MRTYIVLILHFCLKCKNIKVGRINRPIVNFRRMVLYLFMEYRGELIPMYPVKMNIVQV